MNLEYTFSPDANPAVSQLATHKKVMYAVKRWLSERTKTSGHVFGEEQLLHGKINQIVSLRGSDVESTNSIYQVRLDNGEQGIFKPASWKRKEGYNDIPNRTLFKRERAAYIVDSLLDFDLVPPTIIRRIRGRIGSLQQYISGEIPKRNQTHPFPETPRILEQIPYEQRYMLWLFDYITCNADRGSKGYSENIIIKDGRLHAIDNGLTFGNNFMVLVEEFYNKPVPEIILDKLEAFISDSRKRLVLRSELSRLLPQDQINACEARIVHIYNVLKRDRCIKDGSQLLFAPNIETS